MDPVVAGFLANVATDAMTGALGVSLRPTVTDRIETAAEAVATDYDGLAAADLLTVLESARLEDTVEAFETAGEPLPVEDLATVFCAERHAIKYLDADAEVVVEDFLTAIEREIAADTVLWRRLALKYIKAKREDIDLTSSPP